MTRASLPRALVAAASYGCSLGAVHSATFALRNLIKFPLLIAVTAALCALCYYLFARWIARQLDAGAVARATFTIYHDTCVLLCSLSPVTWFLALTIERPDQHGGLGEYPLFVSINVLFIAFCGTLALLRQSQQLLSEHGVPLSRGVVLVGAWLAVSLFVGAQASWYLRPFCGVRYVDAPFILGTEPDFRGATSFYEALFHFVEPPGR